MTDTDAFEYDIFLSHNRADKDWTRMLAARIEREKWNGRALKTFYSERDIRPGQSIPQRMQDALTKSRKVALILSPEALASPWVEVEYLSTLYADLSARQEHLIPLMRRECEPPYLVAPLRYIDFRDDANFEPAFRELLVVIKDEPLPDGVETLHYSLRSEAERGATSLHIAPIPRTPPYGFVARYDDQGNDLAARVSQSLKQDRAVALLGSGGVGKTTLAAEIVRAFLPSPAASGGRAGDEGRVVWVSADGRADFALTTLLDEAATQLGSADLRTLALEQKTDAVRNLLAESQTIIVLDNFETIAAEQQKAIATFVNTLSSCPVLITTRSAIEGMDEVKVGAMSEAEARDFLKRANVQPNAIDDVARLAERNPAVMRWIIGQLNSAQRLSDIQDDLSHGAGDAATRVFGRSFGLLNTDAQHALLSLALCVPSANRAALAFTAGFGDDRKRLNDALKQLAGLQLLETDEKSERLSVVGLTRRFTRAQLDRDSNAAEYRRRFVDYFVRYAEAHPETTPEDFDALEAERENLLAAMDAAFAAEDWHSVMRIAAVIAGPYRGLLGVHGYWDDAIVRGEQAAEAARRVGDDWHIGAFANALGAIHANRGEYELAKKHYEHAVEIAKKLNAEQGFATTLHQLGNIAYQQGDYATARQRYAESLEINKKLGNQSGIAITTWNLGNIDFDQGNLEEAQKQYDEALETFRKTGDQKNKAGILHQLGLIAQEQDDYETARQRFAESLEINKKLGNQSGIALTTWNLGNIALRQRNLGQAQKQFEESLATFKRLGDQLNTAGVMHSFGALAEVKDNKIEAARLFREALEIFERLKSPDAKIARESLERVTQR